MNNYSRKLFLQIIKQQCIIKRGLKKNIIRADTLYNNDIRNELLELHRRAKLNINRETTPMFETPENPYSDHLQAIREKYPEFLPRTDYPGYLTNPPMAYRDRIRERLEREDMYRRRDVLNIPEFYVGSIVAVTVADPYSPGKTSRFLGICIQKQHAGLWHKFILRNVIDGQGVEIMYHMYNPTIQKIEVIRLEKRLDDPLMYLRNAPLEYSTFPQDMEPTLIAKDSVVPVNPLKVRLNPKPWLERWERMNLKGVEGIEEQIKEKSRIKRELPDNKRPWEEHDLMLKYRKNINLYESSQIYTEFLNRSKEKRGRKQKY